MFNFGIKYELRKKRFQMSRQRETLLPQVFRAAVVDQTEVDAGEFRIGGHLHVQTRLRLLAGQAVAGHQPCDLHLARRPDRDGVRLTVFPPDLEEQRHLDQHQLVLADRIPEHEFPQTPFHRRMHERIQRGERLRTVFRCEQPTRKRRPVDARIMGCDLVAPLFPHPGQKFRRGIVIQIMADRIGVVNMGESRFQQEMTCRRFSACDPASQRKRFQLFRLRAVSLWLSIAGNPSGRSGCVFISGDPSEC